jgi:hypothetical protein
MNARVARMRQMAEQERRTGKLEPHLLYFMDTEKPAGQKFLGACIVEAYGLVTAIEKAHALGINPGGAVVDYETSVHDPALYNRLITSDDEMALLGFTRKVQS